MIRTMSEDDIRGFIELEGATRSERSNLEFKPPFTWGVRAEQPNGDIATQEKVIKSIMGLNHHSLGGVLVIGIEEGKNHQPIIIGLNEEQFDSFQDTESIFGIIDGFSSEKMYYEFSAGKFPNPKGKLVNLVVVTVEQFPNYITMCIKNGQSGLLRQGAVYIRPMTGQPRTEEMSASEFRMLQDLATDNVQKNLENRGYVWSGKSSSSENRIADLEAE